MAPTPRAKRPPVQPHASMTRHPSVRQMTTQRRDTSCRSLRLAPPASAPDGSRHTLWDGAPNPILNRPPAVDAKSFAAGAGTRTSVDPHRADVHHPAGGGAGAPNVNAANMIAIQTDPIYYLCT